jgi:CheY-like chemotaxis protein
LRLAEGTFMKFRDGWNNRVLIVDDQEEIHQDFEEMLNPIIPMSSIDNLAMAFDQDIDESFLPEFELIHAISGKEAYEKIKESIRIDEPIAVAYMDVRMPPGWDGVETTSKIREFDKDIEIVIMTAYSSRPLSEIVRNIDLLHKLLYIRKPFAREEIQQMTISLVEKWNVERELAITNERLARREVILKEQLEDALTKMLSGFLPICAGCKKIREESGQWTQIDVYIQNHTDTKFTYGICPECKSNLYPELYERGQEARKVGRPESQKTGKPDI